MIVRKFPADFVTFTEEILNVKIHFLCSGGKVRNDSFSVKFAYVVNEWSPSLFLILEKHLKKNLKGKKENKRLADVNSN